MWRTGTFLSMAFLTAFSLALSGCSLEEKDSPTAPTGTRGAISLRLAIDPASPFKAIARTGTLTVSADDMSTLSAPLTLGDSTVTGQISGIPAGKRRLIDLKVYGDSGILGYRGSAYADILPDSTTRVSLDLVRTTGNAEVTGRILEDTVTAPWLSPMVINLGAQASATLGAVLDVDLGEAWTSAKANANQEDIDLVFLYFNAGFHLENAVSAKAAGIVHAINLTNSYDAAKIRNVLMVKVASRPPDAESARRAFAAGPKIQGSEVTAGDIFLVESTEGMLALVTVLSIQGSTNTGTVSIRLERSPTP